MIRALGLNHVSLNVTDLDAATRFYVDVLGCRPIPSPDLGYPVQWLELGGLQIHLFVRGEEIPASQHFAVDVADAGAARARAEALGILDGRPRRLPDGTVQLYIRDPSGNRIELDGMDGLDGQPPEDLPVVPGPPGATLYSGRPRPH